MISLQSFNIITLIIISVFVFPLVAGIFERLSKERIEFSLGSLLSNLGFLGGLIASIYMTKKIFFENETGFYKTVYDTIPQNFKDLIQGRDMLVYTLVVPLLLMLLTLVFRLMTIPVYRFVISPLSDSIYRNVNSMGAGRRAFISVLWKLPKAVFMVLILGFGLNFYSYYFPNQDLARWMNDSATYQALYKNALHPALNSNIAKGIPVLVNDSFRQTIGSVMPEDRGNDALKITEELARQLTGGNLRVIQYFNGVTLDEAIKTSPEIDAQALEIVGNESNSRKKAYLLYQWVSKNMKYDYEKARKISVDSRGISSGSIEAFNTRRGICFDYSCLYISMCRAVGLKVRLVTGLGYSGVSWGDHAWNQVYSEEEERWINVDTTFGSTGNYFDKDDFSVDHRYDEVQGEW